MRQEFSKKVKLAAFQRANGCCDICHVRLSIGNIEYDHALSCAMGGTAELDNCVVTCRACHRIKTSKQDIPTIAKSNRLRSRNAGIKRRRVGFRGWRKFNGTIVHARER